MFLCLIAWVGEMGQTASTNTGEEIRRVRVGVGSGAIVVPREGTTEADTHVYDVKKGDISYQSSREEVASYWYIPADRKNTTYEKVYREANALLTFSDCITYAIQQHFQKLGVEYARKKFQANGAFSDRLTHPVIAEVAPERYMEWERSRDGLSASRRVVNWGGCRGDYIPLCFTAPAGLFEASGLAYRVVEEHFGNALESEIDVREYFETNVPNEIPTFNTRIYRVSIRIWSGTLGESNFSPFGYSVWFRLSGAELDAAHQKTSELHENGRESGSTVAAM